VTTDGGYNRCTGLLYLGSKTHTGGDEFHEIKIIILENKTYFTPLPIFKLKNMYIRFQKQNYRRQ
jgi:hypothetical protein